MMATLFSSSMPGQYLPDTCGVIQPSSIDAVVFDIGGVFLVPHPDPIREVLAPLGVQLLGDEAFLRAHYRGAHAVAELHVDEADPSFWMHYITVYLREIGVAGDRVEACLAVWPVLHERPVHETWRWAQQHNIDALRRFAEAAMPLAVVSNNDGTAPEQLRRFGVCQVGPGPFVAVAAIVDSGQVGVAKPDPAIFRPALDALGTDPARTLYVGDMVHADVKGARAAGMPVVQIDPYDFHDGFDHARVPHLDALADLLF
jgi:putative hydrolase of the HAD superfamily